MKVFIQNIYLDASLPVGQNGRDFLVWLKKIIPASIQEGISDSDSCGLYITTKDLGAASSIQFWRDGLTNGFAFANPREFPATLSNYLSSLIAMQLAITGPNYTFVGQDAVHNDAFIQALLDLQLMDINECLIVNIAPLLTHSNSSDQQTVITHLVSENNVDGNTLASVKLCPKNNDTNKLKSIGEAICLLKKNASARRDYCIQTDTNNDLLIQPL